jgi:hypothetical protein
LLSSNCENDRSNQQWQEHTAHDPNETDWLLAVARHTPWRPRAWGGVSSPKGRLGSFGEMPGIVKVRHVLTVREPSTLHKDVNQASHYGSRGVSTTCLRDKVATVAVPKLFRPNACDGVGWTAWPGGSLALESGPAIHGLALCRGRRIPKTAERECFPLEATPAIQPRYRFRLYDSSE